MLSNVKAEVKGEIFDAVKKSLRFNVKGLVYDEIKGGNISSQGFMGSLISLMKSCDSVDVYKINGQSIPYLEEVAASKDRGKYSLRLSEIPDGTISNLLSQSEDEPERGSIVFESDSNDDLLMEFVKNCFDPGFISSLKYVMSSSALRRAKKEDYYQGNKVCVVLSESGVDTIAFFSTDQVLRKILEYSYENSFRSTQFEKSYCE